LDIAVGDSVQWTNDSTNQQHSATSDDGVTFALTPEPATVQVELPAATKDRLTAAAASGSRLVLRIDGVEIPSDRGALVKVYLNEPDATRRRRPTNRAMSAALLWSPLLRQVAAIYAILPST
jgi:hypothetical protein